MKNVLRSLMLAAVVCGLSVVLQGTASAHGGHGHGGGHIHNHGGHGHSSFYPSFPRWHDTSHFHWHPGSFQRHGNHFHYIPGHYDLHRTGHWHH